MGGAIGPLVLMGSLFILLIIGTPIAYALGISAFATAFYVSLPLEAILLKLSDGVDNFSLLAIPFFVLAGALMAEGGMAWRLVAFANIFVGFMRGGLAMVNILASMFFGGISGSAVADTSSIGSIMIPMMKKQGYDDHFSVNITITSATQGIIIPPSHNAIIYTYAAGGTISIAQLFMAGIIPGVMIGLALMVLAFVISKQRGYPRGRTVNLGEALRITWEALAGLLTVVIIVGGVIGGIFTPTESAAVACVWAFFVTMFIYRDITWSDLPMLLGRVTRTVGMVMIMIGFSISFGYMMAILRIPAIATEFFVHISSDKYMFLLWINILLLLLGTFMDLAPMLLICTPIFLPVLGTFNIDPVHFGIIIILNLGIGLLTPPVGPTMVVGCAIGKVSMEAVSRTILIFYVPMVVVLLLVTYIPELSLWLPRTLGY